MALLLDAFEEGSEPPLPFIEANVGTENRLAVSDEMVDRWEAINIHVWPQPILGETPFDSDVLRRQGLQVSDLQGVLNVRVAEAVALFNGETAPEPEQAEALANSLGVSVEQLLLNSPDDTTLQLFLPRIKDDVLEIGRRHHTDEAGARSLIREQFALAARSDGDPQSRLDAAIHRLLRTDEA